MNIQILKSKLIVMAAIILIAIGAAQAATTNFITFSGVFVPATASKLEKLIGETNKVVEVKERTLLSINSPGGQVDALYQIMHALEASEVPVDTFIEGYAFSCGAMMFLAGESRIMTESAIIMFHFPSYAGLTSRDMYNVISRNEKDLDKVFMAILITGGSKEKLEKLAEEMSKLDAEFMSALAAIIGKPAAEKVLRHGYDTYMTAREAKASGIATHIIGE